MADANAAAPGAGESGAAGDAADAAGKKKGGAKGMILGLVAAAALGGGGFYAVFSGLVLAAPPAEAVAEAAPPPTLGEMPQIGFVPLDPMLVSLGPGAGAAHLRFAAQVEVPAGHEAEVAQLMPRIVDVLNGYLRAVDPALIADPGALTRLRAQMLRRVQIVAGKGRVRDLLIMEFVLS